MNIEIKSRLILIEIHIKCIFVIFYILSIVNDEIFFENQVFEILNFIVFFQYIFTDFCYIVYLMRQYQIYYTIRAGNIRNTDELDISYYKCVCFFKVIFSIYFIIMLYAMYENDFKKCHMYNMNLCISYGIQILDSYVGILFLLIKYYRRKKRFKICTQPDDNCCLICIDENNRDKWSVLTCKHKFHLKCIKQWYKKSKTCPTCRRYNV